MKCPKCGYQSFNHLAACKKCGRDLTELQEKLGFDRSQMHEIGAPVEQPGTEEGQSAVVQDDPALEESLQGFFESLEEPDENAPLTEEDPFAVPPPESLDPGEASFENRDGTLTFSEDSAEDAMAFSFDDLAEGIEETPPFQEEEEPVKPSAEEPLIPNEPLEEEGMPAGNTSGEDTSVPVPENSLAEKPEDDDFFSFADLDEELGKVEEADEGFELENGDGTESPDGECRSADGFVSPQEIEQAMAADADLTARADSHPAPLRSELEQGEFPFAGDGIQQEDFLGKEEESPPRSVLGLRLLAILTDLGILTAVFAAFITAGEMVRQPNRTDWFKFSPDRILDLATPYFLVLFILCFGYFTLFHFLTGQTPGKMLWRVRVEGETGTPLSLAQSFLRTSGGLLALLPAGLGFLSIVINRQQRGWNDRLANSRVVDAGSEGF